MHLFCKLLMGLSLFPCKKYSMFWADIPHISLNASILQRRLCKSKNNILAEYTLRDMTKPIGLAEYRVQDALPENLQTALPTIEEIEAELAKDLGGRG